MKRKIATLGETDITVHPAAGILLLLGLLTRWRALLICTYASILLHETAHAAVSALWHHPPQEVEITPLGAMMRLEDEERLPLTARISVILAGPLMTLILCALSLWLTQNGVIPREAGRLIFLSNAGILLVNLLPALPLDGGRLLSAVLLRLLRRETCWRVMRIIGTAAGALAAAGCFLLYSAVSATTSEALTELRALMDRKIRMETRGKLPIQPMAMLSTRTLHHAVRALHPTRMTQLYIIEPGTMRLLGILTEQQLIAAYLSAPQRTLAEEVDA